MLRSFIKVPLFFVLGVIFVQALYGLECKNLFTESVQDTDFGRLSQEQASQNEILRIGQLDPQFFKWHRSTYTKDVSTSAVKNQCALGTCHLFAWSSYLENLRQNKNQPQIALSTSYLSFMQWREESLSQVERLQEATVFVNLGESPRDSFRRVEKFGLVPEDVFKPFFDFSQNENYKRISSYITHILSRAKFSLNKTSEAEKKEMIIKKTRQDISDIFDQIAGLFSYVL